MASVNRVDPLLNHEGVPARRIGPLAQLERSVMSCLLWEDEFYEDGQTIGERIAALVKEVPAADVARVAVRAKLDMRLRHVLLLLARELLRTPEGRAEFGAVAAAVFARPDDLAEFLAIYWKDDKAEPLAKQAKRHLGEAFRKFDEYQLAKYNGGKKAVKLRDALRITRPKPNSPGQAELWRKLVKGELATPDTWEVELSKSADKKASWGRLLREEKLGGLALLRNLRNMREAGLDDALIREGIARVRPGKLLPINFVTAARHNPTFEPELEAKFFECFAGKPKLAGRTVLLVDISPSMGAKLSARSELTRTDVACSLAMIAREMFADVRVFSFATARVEVAPRRGFGLRDAILNSQPSNGTLLGAALKDLPGHDRLIVLTDEESQDAVPQLPGYMVNVASTKNGVGYGTWLHIDGWSDRVLDYLARHEAAG